MDHHPCVVLLDRTGEATDLALAALRNAGHEPRHHQVESFNALTTALQTETWELILVDLATPGLDVVAGLTWVRQERPESLLIATGAHLSVETAVAAMRAGADDCLPHDELAHLPGLLTSGPRRQLAEPRSTRPSPPYQLTNDGGYHQIIESLADGVMVVDQDGVIRLANPALARLLGVDRAETLVDAPLPAALATSLGDALSPEMFERLGEPGTVHRQGECRLDDTSKAPVDLEYVLVASDWATQPALLVTLRDITARKAPEQRLQRRAVRAEALARVAARLNDQLDLSAVLTAVCEETARALGMPVTIVGLVTGQDEVTGQVEARGLPTATREQTAWLARLPVGPVGEVHGRRRGPLTLFKDLQVICRAAKVDPAKVFGLRTMVSAELRREGQTLGTLSVASLDSTRRFADDELALLVGIANQAVQAIVNARLYARAQRRSAHVQALHSIDLATNASLDLRVVLHVILDQVISHLAVHAASILLTDPAGSHLETAASRGFRVTGFQAARVRVGEGLAGQAARERRTIDAPMLTPEMLSRQRQDLARVERFVSAFAVPLIAKGHVKGVLELFHRLPLRPDREWFQLLEALATQAAMAIDNASLFRDLQRSNTDLILAYDATIEGWSRALELRDKETEGHTLRVTELTLTLATELGLNGPELVHIRRGALLHDIGKMGIPDRILHKTGPLSDREWEMMRQHPVLAFELLSPIAFLRPALDIPHYHHEQWDGTGYPRGLKGEAIPLAARIFTIADVWDALRSDRPYRRAWSEDQVLEHIRSLAGSHFDPRVVDAFLRLQTNQPGAWSAPPDLNSPQPAVE